MLSNVDLKRPGKIDAYCPFRDAEFSKEIAAKKLNGRELGTVRTVTGLAGSSISMPNRKGRQMTSILGKTARRPKTECRLMHCMIDSISKSGD